MGESVSGRFHARQASAVESPPEEVSVCTPLGIGPVISGELPAGFAPRTVWSSSLAWDQSPVLLL